MGGSFQASFFSHGPPILHFLKSSVWPGIKNHISTIIQNSLWIVGTGEHIHLWTDSWLDEPLVNLFNNIPSSLFNIEIKLKESKCNFVKNVWCDFVFCLLVCLEQ